MTQVSSMSLFYSHPLAGWLGHVLIQVAGVQQKGQTQLCKCLSGLCITFAYSPRQVTGPSRGVGIMSHPTKGIQGVESGGQ